VDAECIKVLNLGITFDWVLQFQLRVIGITS